MGSKAGLTLWLIALGCIAAGCLDERVVSCRDGLLCPDGTACDDAHRGCVLPEQLERCDGEADGTTCSYRGTRDGACYEGVCLPAGCGNGVADEGEVCDDGNRLHGDGCSADCRSNEVCGNRVVDVTKGESCEPPGTEFCRADCVSSRCGDGVVDEGDLEACDLGAANAKTPDAACRPNCQPQRCGDGVQDSDEVCDDGNNLVGDGCSSDCKSTEQCGNGVVDVAAGESCEPPGTEFCRADCVTMRCGDGTLDEDAFEQCDDGAQNSLEPDAACRPNCQPRRCGDGIKDSGEACDDGNQRNGDGCSYDCGSDERCSNGYWDLATGEECDDGNLLSHDGCSSTCLMEKPRTWRVLTAAPSLGTITSYDHARQSLIAYDSQITIEQTGRSWKWASFGGTSPTTYGKHGQTWDASRQLTLIFGGESAGLRMLNETWLWDGASWRTPTSAAPLPAPRVYPALTHDPIRKRAVLFGGIGENGPLGDTWEWDGRRWEQRHPAHSPSPGRHSSTFDPRQGLVTLLDGQTVYRWSGEDWSTDLALTPEPTSGVVPRIAFITSLRRLVILHLGSDASAAAGAFWMATDAGWTRLDVPLPSSGSFRNVDLFSSGLAGSMGIRGDATAWEWRDTGWVAVTENAAATRELWGTVMAHSPLTRTGLLFDHRDEGRTFVWRDEEWSEVEASHPKPQQHALAFDFASSAFVMFGGETGDTFKFDGQAWTQLSGGIPPSLRSGSSLVSDPRHQRLVLFGGLLDVEPFGLTADTWFWEHGAWREISVASRPPPRFGHAATYDPINQVPAILGGNLFIEPFPIADFWTLDDRGWREWNTAARTERMWHSLVYDGNRRSLLAFGGSPFDVWEISIEEDGTYGPTRLVDGASDHLPSVNGECAVYDAAARRTLMVGSNQVSGPPSYDTYAFSYSAPAQPDEACRFGFDTDGDALIGCNDPDCWPFCTPLCPPGAPCDLTYPHCGDGECNEALETCRMCPEDCGACPALCGDFFCDAPETIDTCPGDCTSP